jgi:hypothetical protein
MNGNVPMNYIPHITLGGILSGGVPFYEATGMSRQTQKSLRERAGPKDRGPAPASVCHQTCKTYEGKYGREVTSVEHRAGWDATF